MEYDPAQRDLTAPYICSVIAELEAERHPFYTFFIHAVPNMVGIHQYNDYRTGRGYGNNDPDPLCSYSVAEFMARAGGFHEFDTFIVSFADGFPVGRESDFTAETVEFFYTEYLRRECRRSLSMQRMLTLSLRYVELCRLTEAERTELETVFRLLNEEVVGGLKLPEKLRKKSL